MSNKHQFDIRVYYEDTDSGGIVYYANYLKFCERARTEYLRAAGLENTALAEREGVFIVVRHVDADYRGSARLDDTITVETGVKEMKRASFVMEQAIFCRNKLIFAMKVTLVCVNQDIRPVKIPERLSQVLKSV